MTDALAVVLNHRRYTFRDQFPRQYRRRRRQSKLTTLLYVVHPVI